MGSAQWFLAGIACLAAILAAYVWWRLRRRAWLPARERARLRRAWAYAVGVRDPALRVLEAEKVVDQLLGSLGYRGSFGEKLKVAGPRLHNREALWRAHKLRNRLAHEPGVRIAEQEAQRAVRAFGNVLDAFAGRA